MDPTLGLADGTRDHVSVHVCFSGYLAPYRWPCEYRNVTIAGQAVSPDV